MKAILLSLLVASLSFNAAAQISAPGFSDNFAGRNLDENKWNIATYTSPDSKAGANRGKYIPEYIDLSQGLLRIRVTQRFVSGEAQSFGGAIISKDRFGFGTYEFEMRMSSTSATPNGEGKASTGAISSGFLYHNKSESEIDLEFLGNENAIWISSWHNPDPRGNPSPFDKTSEKIGNQNLATRFSKYKVVWTPQAVDVYIDDTHVAHQTKHVPQTPAHIILQHRGTNRNQWGGIAKVGVDRYFFVRSVTFTPLGNH